MRVVDCTAERELTVYQSAHTSVEVSDEDWKELDLEDEVNLQTYLQDYLDNDSFDWETDDEEDYDGFHVTEFQVTKKG